MGLKIEQKRIHLFSLLTDKANQVTSIVIDSKLNNGFWLLSLTNKARKPLTMFPTSKLQSPKPSIFGDRFFHHGFVVTNLSFRRRYTLRQAPPALRFAKGSDSTASSSPLHSNPHESSDPSASSRLTPSVGQPPLQLSQWTLTQKHLVVLNAVACVVSLSVFIFEIIALISASHAWNFALGFRFSPSKSINLLCLLWIQFKFSSCSNEDLDFSPLIYTCRQQFQHRGYSLLQFLLYWFVLGLGLFSSLVDFGIDWFLHIV